MKLNMWLRFLLIFIFCFHSCWPASVFLDTRQANGVLQRTRRYNSGWFEELQKGDLQRECIEEKCSFEEAREVFEHVELTNEFWKVYTSDSASLTSILEDVTPGPSCSLRPGVTSSSRKLASRGGVTCQSLTVPDSCKPRPCQNGGTCIPDGSSYNCLCLPQFRGVNCDQEHKAESDSCLVQNGACEHFCNEDAFGRRLNCSCADGYSLGDDGQSCVSKEPIACGMVPVLQGHKQEEHLRIVGGTECPKGECPWQVLLVYKGKGFCGGVIYKPTWILTASHCLEDTDKQFLKIIAGDHNLVVNESTEQIIQVAEILMHPNYAKTTVDNDIALLRLASPITYTPYALPVCLPTRVLAERDLWSVNLHTVSGWGRRSEHGPTSTVLRRTKIPRLRTQTCKEESGVALTKNMFCAGYLDGRTDSCKGDSGGPLVTEYRKTVFLLGIVSWGKGCARPGNYGIYTRVSNYLEWIHNQTASSNPP